MNRGHIGCFSSLNSLPFDQHGNPEAVALALRQAGRYSAFEVTPRLAGSLERLRLAGRLRHTGGCYPWLNVEVALPDEPRLADSASFTQSSTVRRQPMLRRL